MPWCSLVLMLRRLQLLHCLHDIRVDTLHAPFLLLKNMLMLALMLMSPLLLFSDMHMQLLL